MKKLVVLIDNGHGKNTKGKCSPDKRICEWEYCREIACRLYEKLSLEGIQAILLVPEEKDVIYSNNLGKPVILKTRSRAGMAYANIAKRLTGVKVPILEDEKKRFFRFGRK